MQDLKCESPHSNLLWEGNYHQVAFCSHQLQHAFLLSSCHFYKKDNKTSCQWWWKWRRKNENEDNNDDDVDETNVCPLWLVYNELVARRHKKTFSKHLLSDATPWDDTIKMSCLKLTMSSLVPHLLDGLIFTLFWVNKKAGLFFCWG